MTVKAFGKVHELTTVDLNKGAACGQCSVYDKGEGTCEAGEDGYACFTPTGMVLQSFAYKEVASV